MAGWIRGWITVLAGAAMIVAASPAARADINAAAQWYGAKAEDEKVVFQVLLVLLGHYNGIVDGVFGRNTYSALLDFQRANGFAVDGVLAPHEEEHLVFTGFAALEQFGLIDAELIDERTGLMVPIARNVFVRSSPASWGTHWENADGSIELETLAIPADSQSFESLYQRLSSGSDRTVSYATINDGFFVVSGEIAGRDFYTGFVRRSGGSLGFSISWERRHQHTGSVLSVFLASMIEYPDTFGGAVEATATVPRGVMAGTGFSISAEGHIVTNAHVVENCSVVQVGDLGDATVTARDTDRDLAVIKLIATTPVEAASLQPAGVSLGQEIVILGYPLSDLMGNALTVNTGIVSSLSGIGGQEGFFSIGANVQPGNSGGPILDLDGHVVGVATGKFNEEKLLAELGTTGGTIGFAIDVDTLVPFLAGLDVELAGRRDGDNMSIADVVAASEGFVHQISCLPG